MKALPTISNAAIEALKDQTRSEYMAPRREFQFTDEMGKALAYISKDFMPQIDPFFFFSTTYKGNITAVDIERMPYQFHPWIHACAWSIARNISRLPLVLCDRNNPNNKIKDTWGILRCFERPNPFMTRTTFLQIAVLNLLLPVRGQYSNKSNPGGQVFLLPNLGDLNFDFTKGLVPDMLFPYTTDNVRPARFGNEQRMSQFHGWDLFADNKKVATLGNENLIRIHFANPYDWLQGISNFEPAQIAVAMDIKADIYNTKLFDNNGIPAGLLRSSEYLTEAQRREMLQAWLEEYGGAGNANRVAVLSKGLEYQAIGLTMEDMQHQATKKDVFEKILASFGLNKIALGMYEELNLATIREGRKMLWHDTYLPIAELIAEPINANWLYWFGSDIMIRLDTSGVESLQEDYAGKAATAAVFVNSLKFTPRLACQKAGIPLSEDEIKKYPWLDEKPESQTNQMQLNWGENTTAPKKPALPPPEEPKLLVAPVHKGIIGITAEERQKYSKGYIEKHLDPLEKLMKDRISRFFISQRNSSQDLVDEWLKHKVKSVAEIAEPDDFMLDQKEEDKRLFSIIDPIISHQVKSGSARLEQELGKFVFWNLTDEDLIRYAAMERETMMQINSTTFQLYGDKIADAISEAAKNNLTPQETAKLIKNSIGDVADVRLHFAETIARTETGKVQSQLRFDVFHDEGIEYTEWSTAEDEKVRESHQLNDGEIRRLGIPFPNGQQFPLQVVPDLGEFINCRCVALSVQPNR